MEEIINKIIANRNYHMLSDEQVEAIEQLVKANKVLCEMVDERDNQLSKIAEMIKDLRVIQDHHFENKYKPSKNTTKAKCYEIIYKIGEMLRR